MDKCGFMRGFQIEDRRVLTAVRLLWITAAVMSAVNLSFRLFLDKMYFILHIANLVALAGIFILYYAAYKDPNVAVRDEMFVKTEGESGYLTVVLIGVGTFSASFVLILAGLGSMEYSRELLGAAVSLMIVSVAIYMTYGIAFVYRKRRPRKE